MKQNNEKLNKLIQKIKNGDKKAFNELYKLTSGQLYFFILKIVQNEQDAEDILQESYIKILEKIDEIDPTQNFTSWFYQIAANKSKDLLRRKNKVFFESIENEMLDSSVDENTAFYPEENIDKDELCAQVITAIDELTAEKRACIIMKYYAQMSVNEIAKSLDVPVSTVKNRLFSARKDLKIRFEKLGKAALYSAAPIGIIIWALNRSSLSVCAAFSASTASAAVITAVSKSASASLAGTSATAGTSVAAKIATMSVAQKIVAGTVAATIIGGTTAGTVSVIKQKAEQSRTTTVYSEEITTASTDTSEFISEESFSEETTFKIETEIDYPVVLLTTAPPNTTEKPTAKPSQTETTTTAKPITTQAQTTTKETTKRETTTVTTTAPKPTETTTQQNILIEVTTKNTTAAPATLIIEITDYDDNIVDTITQSVEAGTNLTWDYLIELVSQNGYEAMAGIYGDGIDTVAREGKTYTFTAEL